MTRARLLHSRELGPFAAIAILERNTRTAQKWCMHFDTRGYATAQRLAVGARTALRRGDHPRPRPSPHAHHPQPPSLGHALYLPNFTAGCVNACSPTSAFRSSQREKQPSPSSTCTSDSSARARSLHMRALSVATHIG